MYIKRQLQASSNSGNMSESFRPAFGRKCKQVLPMQQLKHQQRHEAGDFFIDSLKCSITWGFLYQVLQSNP